LNADRDPKDRATQTASEDVWKKETSEYLISSDVSAGLRACRRRAVPVRRASTRRSAVRNDSEQYAGPCPTVRRRVDRWDDGVVDQATDVEIIHGDVEMLRRFGAAFLTVVFELPLSDVTVVDGEKAVLQAA